MEPWLLGVQKVDISGSCFTDWFHLRAKTRFSSWKDVIDLASHRLIITSTSLEVKFLKVSETENAIPSSLALKKGLKLSTENYSDCGMADFWVVLYSTKYGTTDSDSERTHFHKDKNVKNKTKNIP